MDAERRERLKTLVADALEREPDERSAFLEEACVGDTDLRERVDALLRCAAEATSFLETPIVLNYDDKPPDRVGQFTIRRRLSSGGAGTVYEAVQDQPHRTIALKLLHADLGGTGGVVARRFERESEVLASLQHPGIAHVYEAGVHGEGLRRVPYIAMELVRDARPITTYAKAEDLDVRERLELIITICRAVQHGHDRGIVHRDLKPGNILVDGNGEPKVIDFGIARVLDSDEDAHQWTRTSVGDVIGTLPYMSPEQCGGDPEAVDARADVFALGVVLFELLTGRMPQELAGLQMDEVLRTIRTRPPARLARIAPDLDADLDAITAKTLEKEPAHRYQSVSALAADLRRHLDHQPVVARPPSVVRQTRLFARRHRIAVTAAVVTMSTLLVATVLSTVFAIRAEQAAKAESRQRQVTSQVNTYLAEMLAMADPHERGEDVTVVSMLDRMCERLDTEPATLPEVEAEVRSAIADTFLGLRRFDEAETQLRRAITIWRDVGELGHGASVALNNLGILLKEERDDLAGAERAYRESIAIQQALSSANDPVLTAKIGNLASVLIEQGDLAGAEPLVREVIERRERLTGPHNVFVIASLRQLGRLQREQGNLAGSAASLREALAVSRETVDDTHPIVAMVLRDLGVVLQMNDLLDDAYAAHEEAWRLARSARPVGSSDWMSSCEGLAECLVATNRRPEAVTLVGEAYEAVAAEFGPDDERTGRLATLLERIESQ